MNLKEIIGTVAPTLATALGGPLAGLAVKTIGEKLGIQAPTQESVQAAVQNASAADLLKIKEADNQFAKDMKALDVDLAKVSAGDRDSARKREIETKDSWTPRILAAVVLVLYCAVQWYILTKVVNQDMREMVMRALGTLDAAVGLVLAYYFGASAQPSTVVNGDRRK